MCPCVVSEDSSTPTSPVLSSRLTVTSGIVNKLIAQGGYTHSLFNPTCEERAEGGGPPLPGQGLLLLVGGLIEQSGVLDGAIALLELKSVKFLQMVRPGATIQVQVVHLSSRTTGSGKIIADFGWLVVDDSGEQVLKATAVMLMNSDWKA